MGGWLLVLLAVPLLGLPVAARLGAYAGLAGAATAALVPLGGVATIGLVTLLVGHLHLIGGWLLPTLAAAGVVWTVLDRAHVSRLAGDLMRGAARQVRTRPSDALILGAAFALATACTFLAPARTDEVGYHWPAALAWAQAGGWGPSPYRNVNGFPFMEVVYTAPATLGSYQGAHLLHLFTLVAIGLAATGIASALRLTALMPVMAGAMLISVVWDQGYAAYNDTATGAFATAAVAVVLGTRPGPRRGLWVATALLGLAISIKPTSIPAVGLVGLVVLGRALLDAPGIGALDWRAVLRQWLVLGVGTGLVAAAWVLRTYLTIGALRDPAMSIPDKTVLARLPTLADHLVAPVYPFVSGVLGASEPWGGRTSLVVQVFLVPALAWVLWRRGDVARRFALVVVPAWLTWTVFSLDAVRTRFSDVVWVMLVAGVAVAADDVSRVHPRFAWSVRWAWTLCVLGGAVDVSFEMVRQLTA